ncbi:MAG: hypothetical protein A3D16_12345 [Rhodobacterales bacterium RIFCSPHIGHO2_02_FULL_62_130]|nr:MAG: hypothetical protein A3D16_12345 [Rhodobacterales bacterium RIFCSPHIGHO2_02_FULL_62_130]OHC53888.1 MAG: hypothetical protein A3E48_23365 [Rhodobacterales bacterium RIFCSPHIGHO2_12_FULL_62_75]HCZ00136.1 methyltransferase [Rhodobacter sp.]
MNQNRSSAVMQQRTEPHQSLDDFPTPPWATRALCEDLQNPCDELCGGKAPAWTTGTMTCREPAANRGHMVNPLREYFRDVEASDIFDYGAGYPVRDYLFGPLPDMVDWTITNPPFRLAEQFIDRALQTSRIGVAVIVRTAFLEGVGRHKTLFTKHRPAAVMQFTERVVMHKGKLSAKGSTATAYCWIVWEHAHSGPTEFCWIAPCRKRLERTSDYPKEPQP